MLWNTLDRTGTLALLFISNLVLARLLMPEDFGCIAMINVFVAIADIFVHGGFGLALIQKKDVQQIDFSSVFFVNLAASLILYLILFLCAPAISRFYNLPLLTKVLRVQALVLVINSFSVVQLSILKRELRFKSLAKRNVISAFIGLSTGIVCAACGLGVWSLVINLLVTNLVAFFLLWRASSWRPSWEFSFVSVKNLFKFGGLMALSSLLSTVFENLQSFVVGKFFNSNELGYVNQAKKLENVPSGAISSVVSQVSFPVFAKIQESNEKLKYGVRKNILATQFINLPMMALLIIIAEPLILFLYGQRWATSIPYFQILCLSRFLGATVLVNLSVLRAKGKGDVYLYTQLFDCVMAIGLISVSVRHGIYALLFALSSLPYLEFSVCSMINKRIIDYGFWDQILTMLPTFGVTVVAAGATYALRWLIPMNIYVLMVIQVVVFVVIYLGLAKLLRFEAFDLYLNIIKSKFLKKGSSQND